MRLEAALVERGLRMLLGAGVSGLIGHAIGQTMGRIGWLGLAALLFGGWVLMENAFAKPPAPPSPLGAL